MTLRNKFYRRFLFLCIRLRSDQESDESCLFSQQKVQMLKVSRFPWCYCSSVCFFPVAPTHPIP